MKALKHLLILAFIVLGLSSCSTLVPRNATLSSKPDLSKYKYVYITPTTEKTSMSGSAFGSKNGVYGSAISGTVNPADVIAGVFMKHGFIRLPEISETQKERTVIVNYGESGRTPYGLGSYAIEVTVQLLDAATYELICTSTAEGMGDTESDDVRKATLKCLEAVFN